MEINIDIDNRIIEVPQGIPYTDLTSIVESILDSEVLSEFRVFVTPKNIAYKVQKPKTYTNHTIL